MNLKEKTLSGLKWSYIGILGQILLQLVVFSILARLISPDDYGLVSISFMFINLVQLISQIGIGPALVQKREINEKHISSAFIFSVFLGLIVYVLFFVSSSVIARFFNTLKLNKIIRIISFIFIIQSFYTIQLSLLQREIKFKQISIIKVMSYFLSYGLLGIILAFLKYGVWALVFASISQRLFTLIFIIFIKPIRIKPLFYKKEFFELINYGSGFTIGRLLNYIARNVDNFVVGKLLGTTELGIYSRVYAIITLPATYFSSVIDKVLFPAMSQIQDNREKIKEIFLNGAEMMFFLGVVFALFLNRFSNLIILILLGKKWLAAVPVLKVFAFGIPFRTTYKLSDTLSRSLGTVYKRAWRQFIYALLVFLGAYIGCHFKLTIVAGLIVFALFIIYLLMLHLSKITIMLKMEEIIKIHLSSLYYFIFFIIVNMYFSYIIKYLKINKILKDIILLVIMILFSLLFILIFNRIRRFAMINWFIKKIDNKYLNRFFSISTNRK